MPWQYGFNLAHLSRRFAWIEEQARFSAFEVQYSVALCSRDRTDTPFTPDGSTVADFLTSRDVDVALYAMPFYNQDMLDLGRPDSAHRGPGRDPYWLYVAIAEAADRYGWWMLDNRDQRPDGFRWGDVVLYPMDICNPDYRAWFVETVTAHRPAGVHVLRFDNAWDGGSYSIFTKTAMKDELSAEQRKRRPYVPYTTAEVTAAQFELYDALRAEGWRIIANAAWYMENPNDPPERWRFPALAHLDGVMVEDQGAVYVRGRWIKNTDKRRQAVARAWTEHGRVYVHVATWPRDGLPGFADYAEYRRFHVNEARTYGYRLAVNERAIGDQTPWEPEYAVEKPAPLFSYEAPPELSDEEIIAAAAAESQCIPYYPDSALTRAMHRDGFIPVGPEFRKRVNGVEYAIQMANSQVDKDEHGKPFRRAYYCPVPRWNQVHWTDKIPKRI